MRLKQIKNLAKCYNIDSPKKWQIKQALKDETNMLKRDVDDIYEFAYNLQEKVLKNTDNIMTI